jgi:hypothetical protein
MDPGKGWYDNSMDSITLRAEFEEADIPSSSAAVDIG